MQIFTTSRLLAWGELDLPLLGISADWHGKSLNPPVGFCVAADPEALWFVATRQAPALSHSNSAEGRFTPELWKHDTAELFIGQPGDSNYLEFNLAPDGGWWAARFDAGRELSPEQPDFQNQVSAYAAQDDASMWIAALRVPIIFLKENIGFGVGSTGNSTFILNSPHQTFHSAAKLPGRDPDFHQPSSFPKLIPCAIPLR